MVEYYLKDPKTRVFIDHNNETGVWLYSIVVVKSDAFWLCSFNTEQEAMEYIREHKLVIAGFCSPREDVEYDKKYVFTQGTKYRYELDPEKGQYHVYLRSLSVRFTPHEFDKDFTIRK